jgi:hypothetical protein
MEKKGERGRESREENLERRSYGYHGVRVFDLKAFTPSFTDNYSEQQNLDFKISVKIRF